jgi:nuclear transport factor 2 (NTF2) superfamily protein
LSNVRCAPTTALGSLESNFRFTPESRRNSEIAACPKSASSGLSLSKERLSTMRRQFRRSEPPRIAGTRATRTASVSTYTLESRWRNRSEFLVGRPAIVDFLTCKWSRELDYRLIKGLWAFTDGRIAVRFAYEWHDDSGNWFRSCGNENWRFNAAGLMEERHACINDLATKESDRKPHWNRSGPRPPDHASLSDLAL